MFTYADADGDGQTDDLSTMTAVDGAVTTFGYTSGKLSGISTNTGLTTRNYSVSVSGGDLASITNPDSAVHSFGYSGHKLTSDNFAGLTNAWGYDPASGTLRTSQAGGAGTTTVFSASSRGVGSPYVGGPDALVSDPLGRVTVTQFDARGRATGQTDPDGGVWQWALDAAGRVTSETDPMQRVTGYVRDAQGYVTSQSLPGGACRSWVYGGPHHALTSYTDERTKTWSYTYDPDAHLLTETDPLTETWTYTYYTTPGLEGLLDTVEDPLHRIVDTSSYDAARRLTRDTNYYGDYTEEAYDSQGNVNSERDERGKVTTFVNDALGRTTQENEPIAGISTNWDYSGAGLVLSEIDTEGRVTSNVYDSRGLLVSSNDAGAVTLDVYDAAGQLIRVRNADGWETKTAYDADGQPVGTTDTLGNVSVTLYDLDGEAIQERDSLGNLVSYAYTLDEGEPACTTSPDEG